MNKLTIFSFTVICLAFMGCTNNTEKVLIPKKINNSYLKNTNLAKILTNLKFTKIKNNVYIGKPYSADYGKLNLTEDRVVEEINNKYEWATKSSINETGLKNELDIVVERYCNLQNGIMMYQIGESMISINDKIKFEIDKQYQKNVAFSKYWISQSVCRKNDTNKPLFLKFSYQNRNNYSVKEKQVIIDFSHNTINNFITRDKKWFDSLLQFENNVIKYNNKMLKNTKEQNKQRNLKLKKENEEKRIAMFKKQNHINSLKNRKGQFTMRFYDSWTFNGKEKECSNICINKNIENTGFPSLQNAINYKWNFKAKISNTSETIYYKENIGYRDMTTDKTCICKGTNILLNR